MKIMQDMGNPEARPDLVVARTRGDCHCVRPLVALILVGWLAGCTVGPDFKQPMLPPVPGYTASPLAASTVSAAAALGDAQHFSTGVVASGQWWHALGSSRLDRLIEHAFQSNPTLAAAKATLRQAQEIHFAQAGSTL